MSAKGLTVQRHGDETITVRVGRYRETFDTRYLTPPQIAEHVYWALITAGVRVELRTLRDLLDEGR